MVTGTTYSRHLPPHISYGHCLIQSPILFFLILGPGAEDMVQKKGSIDMRFVELGRYHPEKSVIIEVSSIMKKVLNFFYSNLYV